MNNNAVEASAVKVIKELENSPLCQSITQTKGETLGAKKHASKMDHIVKTSLKFTLWFFHLLQQLTAISEITLYMGTQNEDRLT